MYDLFSKSRYIIKRQGLAITGKYKVFGADGKEILMYVEEKSTWFPPTTAIHFYQDEKKKHELLILKENPDEESDNMDVIDVENNQKIGSFVIGDETITEIIKDGWCIFDSDEKSIGKVYDKSLAKTVVRELISHSIPQNLEISIGEINVGEIHQKSKAFGYELELDLSKDVSALMDHRLALAISLLVAYEQGRETD